MARKASSAPQRYLVPNPKAGEVVVLTDNLLNAGLLATAERTMMLSPAAATILRNALLGPPSRCWEGSLRRSLWLMLSRDRLVSVNPRGPGWRISWTTAGFSSSPAFPRRN
jgi:hypothetical protein